MGIRILGSGSYTPKRCMSNEELAAEKKVDTNDEWIRTRTGIETRHVADAEETTPEMGLRAARLAIEKAGMVPDDIDAIIVATFTPEFYTPSTACVIQKRLGITKPIMAFDVNAACTGFVYALTLADGLLAVGHVKNVLVIGTESVTRVTNWMDRSTCILFGDAAGAMVVGRDDAKDSYFYTKAEGDLDGVIYARAFDTYEPLHMEGSTVFRFATRAMVESIDAVLDQAGLTIDDIDFIIPHQANKRIIDYVNKKKKIQPEKVYSNIEHYGNTSSATIPVAYAEMDEANMLKSGMKIILVGFGGGLTWGASLLTV